VKPRERVTALAAVLTIELGLGFALLTGLRVQIPRPTEVVERLIDFSLARPPAPPPVSTHRRAEHVSAAAKAEPKPLGGPSGPTPAHAPPSVEPAVPIRPSVAPSGGGSGSGPALGSGAGGGTGGTGYGESGEGGTDLEQIAGEITPRDYPRHLGQAGIGGRVGIAFTVGVNGRVTRCAVTRSSGVPELDVLTCRLIQQRFVFRPATDRYGRPVSDEVEGEHIWEVDRRY
jgi:protein TonB